MGLVECPACKTLASRAGCTLCDGEGFVSVDTSIGWRAKGETVLGSTSDDITLLLHNVELVLRTLATMPTSEHVRDLAARAHACAQEVDRWKQTPATRAEYDGATQRVLGLHISLRKLQSGE